MQQSSSSDSNEGEEKKDPRDDDDDDDVHHHDDAQQGHDDSTNNNETVRLLETERDDEDDDGDDNNNPYYKDDYDDEENRSRDDPYTYSDDSASLSDAYFLPQSDDDLAHGPAGRYHHRGGGGERDPLNNHPYNPLGPFTSSNHHHHYGSAGSSKDNNNSNNPDQQTSPLWLSGAIQEDVEADMVVPAGSASTLHQNNNRNGTKASRSSKGGGSRKERRQRRQRNHRAGGGGDYHNPHHPYNYQKSSHLSQMRLRQREQRAARERAVARVRGQPQQDKCRDITYVIVFIIQLIIVIVCAIVFGMEQYNQNRSSKNSSAAHYGNSNSNNNNNNGDTTTTTTISGSGSNSSGSGSHTSSSSTKLSTGSYHWTRHKHSAVILTSNDTSGEVEYADLHDTTETTTNSTGSSTDSVLDTSPLSTPSSSVEAAFFFSFDSQNIVELVAITGFYACILTYISFGFMLILEKALIQVMLVFSVLLALAWGLIGLSLDPYGVISIMGFTALLITLGYAMYNWTRIPFAATNLYTALCAIRCTADITILGLISIVVAFAWSVLWMFAFVGLVNVFHSLECGDSGGDLKEAASNTGGGDYCDSHKDPNHIVTIKYWPLYLLLFLSFHWTNTVIKNVVRVTTSNVIAKWWFQPESIGPVCTSTLRQPLIKALTKRLGSICHGSLVINFAQIIILLCNGCSCLFGNSECMLNHRHRKHHNNNNIVTVGSMVSEVDSAAESVALGRRLCTLCDRIDMRLKSCNRWAFTYIGVYGYGFYEGGSKALQLFETREWLDVVRDNLIQNVLSAASIVIGGSAGTFAVVVEEADGELFAAFHMPTFSAFVVGGVLGYVLSNILLLGLVGSAVNTILVCFAAGPFEFEKAHPRLSREMREIWSQHVWEEQPNT